MNYILFDGDVRTALLPFTYTKPVADIRVGILTIREKWEKHLGSTTTTVTEEYLEEKYPMVELEENVLLNASFLPTDSLVDMVRALTKNQAIFKGEDVIAFYTNDSQDEVNFANYEQIEYQEELLQIRNTWDIFSLNDKAIRADFDLITDGRTSEPIPDTVNCINKKDIFIEEGAKLTFATLNASSGPIYIGENAEIMEGVVVRGALAMCENSVLKLGAKIYGATTLGPHCKVGGEVNNSVLMGYSSKGHDGFLGNSVLGEWCNIGADSNNSNLKNNYAEVKLWSYDTGRFAKTGLQFCGLMMGDHSKCGINTMFNTGTVVGVSANIFGSGFPRNFVPSFSWGGASGFTEYKTNKVFEVAEMVMKRRNIEFDEKEQRILSHVFEQTKQYRNY
ncbi:GlmU family protein [Tenacibaculum finnmarkense]|uniref:Glucose-1-phosphate thymidylyltransferase n=1 Tax=Tenacibaculum finnmarkense genomovar ulcerans TaxID=2781388 RepID=A0A2I2LDJ9_9FLAO|nr:GlmU family protein [Tenacibaculum finnmarkense]ALU74605.1 glucose-1-phosphate thymidylyltransferase [Tenacibaculum dicentrarchi]MBE7687572.1 glucose-1-phosphate thymidylyltransferase [Tenacibaculum finnmarkense genomovar ulcerans]MBE7697504.1 glucose-1-phosphate thymidylyltransferase [Tenacibaculum finnmarkense genomovar ulcerans]MCD8429738.1 GlmU family protein [Tenacibaculum finnmarkense genomovar ulcerans]MCG8761839.1 glucose-1-phosphate thymidylyltransferase [Tenacibaculum finnmarkense